MSASRYFRVLVVLVVLVSLLVPLMRPALAQDDDGINDGLECPEGLVPSDEVVDLCVLPEGEDETTDDAVVDDTTDGGEDVADDATDVTDDADDVLDDAPTLDDPDATDDDFFVVDPDEPLIQNITFVSYSCPVNWDPADREPEDSHDVCRIAPAEGIAYEIGYQGRTVVEVAEQQDVDLSTTGIPMRAGTWSITALPLADKGTSVAFCVIYDANDGQRSLFLEPVPDGYMNFTLAEGEELNCEWFSTSLTPEAGPDADKLPIQNLRIVVYSCPVGTDAAGTDFSALKTACVFDRSPDFPFAIWRDDQLQFRTTARPDNYPDIIDVQANLENRPLEGRWQIDLPFQPGYGKPVTRCAVGTTDGPTLDPDTDFGTIVNSDTPVYSALSVAIGPGQDVVCHWFMVESSPRPAQTRGMNIYVRQCPEGIDPTAVSNPEENRDRCNFDPASPVTFTYRMGDGENRTATTDSGSVAQLLENGGTPSVGNWIIVPTVTPGSGDASANCTGFDLQGNANQVFVIGSIDERGFDIDTKPDFLYNCTLYLAPVVEDSLVVVTTWSCPDGVDPAALTQIERKQQCTRSPDSFVLIAFNPDEEGDVSFDNALVSDANGSVSRPLQSGNVFIFALFKDDGEFVPVLVQAISCDHTITTLNQVQTIEPALSAEVGNAYFTTVADGDRLDCDLFGVTTDLEALSSASQLTIARWDCPADLGTDATYEDHLLACDSAGGSDVYTYSGGGSVTALNGFAEIESIVLDGTMITDTVTQQSGEPSIVYCSSKAIDNSGGTFPEAMPMSGATFTITVEGARIVYCDWFIHNDLDVD